MFTDLKFSWYKNDELNIKQLIKVWNDNFHILEKPIDKDKIKDNINFEYELIVYRNKRFFILDISLNTANYLIWKLNLTTFMKFEWNRYYRVFYNKSAHGKVMMGYKHPNPHKYEDEYATYIKK